MSFIKDLYLMVKAAKYLPGLFEKNADDNSEGFFPELEIQAVKRATPWYIAKETFKNLCSTKDVSYDPIIKCDTLDNPEETKELWFFINGVTVDREFVKANGKALSKLMGGKTINVLHNPTQGLVKDLAEALIERSLNFRQDISLQMTGVILAAIRAGYNVKIIAHSQGSIILSSIIDIIREKYDETVVLKGVEIYTFGAALDELKNIDGVFYEHFANEHDVVAQFGVINCRGKIPGKLYVRKNAKGHMFNTHYIGAMSKGLYCGGNSEFYKRYVAK